MQATMDAGFLFNNEALLYHALIYSLGLEIFRNPTSCFPNKKISIMFFSYLLPLQVHS